MMNSVNAERAVSVRSVLAIPALLLIVMSVHSSQTKAQDRPAGTQAKAKVELTTDPSPAQKGSNTIRVKLTDAAGKPITGAQVTVTFFMAAMPTMNMPEMKSVIKGEDKGGGMYEGKGDLGSGGMWDVTVTAQQDGKAIVTKKLTVKAMGM
jgi:nitrogen fixation protein FixH